MCIAIWYITSAGLGPPPKRRMVTSSWAQVCGPQASWNQKAENRFLEHPLLLPQQSEESHTPYSPPPGNFAFKNSPLKPITETGIIECKPPILLAQPCSKPSCCSFMSDSLWPHGLPHTRPPCPCPSPSPRVFPSSCSLHQWCHPAISTSDSHFSLCSQSFQASGTFPMGGLFVSDDQNTRASASVLPVNTQG